jgi:hypothetical protein
MDLVGNPDNTTSTAFTVTTFVSAGYYYNFRVRAKNIYGFGSVSEIYNYQAAQEP